MDASPLAGHGLAPRPRHLRMLLVPFLLVPAACATQTRDTAAPTVSAGPTQPLAPEVWVSAGGEAVAGKITALNGDEITFLPAPYWGVESRTLRLDEIGRIQVKRPGRGTRAFVYTFTTVFSVVGLSAGGSARYDVDYQDALLGSAILGVGAGLIGVLVASLTSSRTHHVRKLNDRERRDLIWRLMGHDGPLPREEGT